MQTTNEPWHLDKWRLLQYKTVYLPTSCIEGPFKYGDGAKLWGYVVTNTTRRSLTEPRKSTAAPLSVSLTSTQRRDYECEEPCLQATLHTYSAAMLLLPAPVLYSAPCYCHPVQLQGRVQLECTWYSSVSPDNSVLRDTMTSLSIVNVFLFIITSHSIVCNLFSWNSVVNNLKMNYQNTWNGLLWISPCAVRSITTSQATGVKFRGCVLTRFAWTNQSAALHLWITSHITCFLCIIVTTHHKEHKQWPTTLDTP
jgi:hypothetical protein